MGEDADSAGMMSHVDPTKNLDPLPSEFSDLFRDPRDDDDFIPDCFPADVSGGPVARTATPDDPFGEERLRFHAVYYHLNRHLSSSGGAGGQTVLGRLHAARRALEERLAPVGVFGEPVSFAGSGGHITALAFMEPPVKGRLRDCNVASVELYIPLKGNQGAPEATG